MRLHLDRRLSAAGLAQAAAMRLADAYALLNTEEPARRTGAVYLGGYALECSLKARLCRDRGEQFLHTQFHVHDLRVLARKTGKWPALQRDSARLDCLEFIASAWNVTIRYRCLQYRMEDVKQFLQRVEGFSQWLLER